MALADDKLVCRNPKGVVLKSVPKAIGQSDTAEQLRALRDWLTEHERECIETVESWMLRSLSVPRRVLEEVWADPGWRRPLENTVVVPLSDSGEWDTESLGLLRGVEAKKGIGVVTLEGETAWIQAGLIAVPHPILLGDVADFRELATELGIEQGVAQLFRETYEKPKDRLDSATSIDEFSGGRFEQLIHALGRCRKLGYRVRGGFAVCPVWENDRIIEARYWIGSDAPEAETYTGDLLWVNEREAALPLRDIGPVAYSEGIRMAAAIHAGRKVEKEVDDA